MGRFPDYPTRGQLITHAAVPFAFDTPGLDTGIPAQFTDGYVPRAGDLIANGWFSIPTAFDGTTPAGDVFLLGASLGLFSQLGLAVVDMSGADQEPGAGYTIPITSSLGDHLWDLGWPTILETGPATIIVNQDGLPLVAASVAATNPATVPTTVVLGVNDTFVFNGTTYTVAPGVYGTLDALQSAMAAAASPAPAPFSDVVTLSNDGATLTATDATGAGSAGNGLTLNVGPSDFLVTASGFADGQQLAGGTGGLTGATQGAGVLYIVTARL